MEENDLKRLAQQLRKPTGEDGVRTGEIMFQTNESMIRRTIELLSVTEGEKVLEMGYGNGAHLEYLFTQANNLQYTGIDISETMQQIAMKLNQGRVKAGIAEFLLGNGLHIPLEDAIADKFFTVNTIYFWDDHATVLQEIKRVLKPGGIISLGFGSRKSMEKLPFVKNGFQLFDPESIKDILEREGFVIAQILVETEEIQTKLMEVREREMIFVVAEKTP